MGRIEEAGQRGEGGKERGGGRGGIHIHIEMYIYIYMGGREGGKREGGRERAPLQPEWRKEQMHCKRDTTERSHICCKAIQQFDCNGQAFPPVSALMTDVRASFLYYNSTALLRL